jgi:ABC-type amino acid transport substrate-binding protein
MHILRLLILVLFACGCSCGSDRSRGGIRIGIDPLWYPVDFGPQTSYVNGYTEDLLLEMARYSGMQFELIPASWDNLLQGMREGKYDAIITSLPAYEYNQAKYDFSKNFLDLGPVLIVPDGSKKTDLDKLGGDMVGIISGDPSELLLAKHPTIVVRYYSSIPSLLDAAAKGDIDAALLNQIPAVNFISDLYAGVLMIAGKPMTDQGIHLVGPKGGISSFNKNLEALRKKKTLDELQKKWGLVSKH